MSNYVKINKSDIANGPGVRVSIFFSGCEHYCEGCFNSEAWDFNCGKIIDDKVINEVIEAMRPSYIKGLTVLGGEPMHPKNVYTLLALLRSIKKELPDKSIWVYTGYTYEDLVNMDFMQVYVSVLSIIDVLVDGRFEISLKDISLRFRGSSNQRLIDVKETLKNGKIIEWSDWQHNKKGII